MYSSNQNSSMGLHSTASKNSKQQVKNSNVGVPPQLLNTKK